MEHKKTGHLDHQRYQLQFAVKKGEDNDEFGQVEPSGPKDQSGAKRKERDDQQGHDVEILPDEGHGALLKRLLLGRLIELHQFIHVLHLVIKEPETDDKDGSDTGHDEQKAERIVIGPRALCKVVLYHYPGPHQQHPEGMPEPSFYVGDHADELAEQHAQGKPARQYFLAATRTKCAVERGIAGFAIDGTGNGLSAAFKDRRGIACHNKAIIIILMIMAITAIRALLAMYSAKDRQTTPRTE